MGNSNQSFDGPNGSYAVCYDCGCGYGSAPAGAFGMWKAECAICGETLGVADALHDFNITDDEVRHIIEQATRET